MTARTGPTNEQLKILIADLLKESSVQKAAVWRMIAEELSKPSRQRREVNLSRINRFASGKETIVVPGKVLGSGIVEKSLTVAAFAFSEKAKQRIEESKGKTLTIEQLLKQNPKGSGLRVIG